jgi:hypothetical protein
MGRVEVVVTPRNDYLVLDHYGYVTLPDGTTVHNAFRVTPAGDGSGRTFAVLYTPGTTDEEFAKDIAVWPRTWPPPKRSWSLANADGPLR